MRRRERMMEDLDRDIREHIEMETQDNVERGMSPEEARYAAVRKFGNVTRVKEETREVWSFIWLEQFMQDIRYALRMLRKSPGFTSVAVLTLALGIGANTAVFSAINGLLLRPMPIPHPEQMTVLSAQQGGSRDYQSFSYPDYQDIRSQTDAFTDILAYRVSLVGLSVDGKGEHCIISRVTGNYFTTAGVQPALGRLILPTEGQNPGADPVLVLGYVYWQKRFGGDKSVVGKQAVIDGHPVTIVGVAPKGFPGLYAFINMDGYVPLSATAGLGGNEPVEEMWTHREDRSLQLKARLKPGMDLRQATASLQVVAQRLAEQHPETDKGIRLSVFPERLARPEPDPDNSIPKVSLAFAVLAVLVLLVACFNIANALLVRATARKQEMAIRAAMGAGWIRLVRQCTTESLLLALLGGAGGLLLGGWASHFLSSLPLGTDLPIEFDFQPDVRVYLFTLAAVLLTTVVVGIIPSLLVTKTDVNTALREGGRGSFQGRRRHFVRNTLVVGQLAGSLMLLVVAGLFLRSLDKAQKLYLGFNPDHVIDVSVDIHEIGYEEAQGKEFYRSAEERIRALPGVVSVAQAFSVPMGLISSERKVIPDDLPLESGQVPPDVSDNTVTPSYFETLRIPLKRGRTFADADNENAPHVAVLNETMAKKFWPKEDALGRRFKSKDSNHAWAEFEVIGIVQDGKYRGIVEDPIPFFYTPLAQDYLPLRTIQVRTSVPPENLELQIASTIRELAPGLPVTVKTMDQDLQGLNGFLFFWFGAELSGTLGLLGLILAVVGVYSVVSYAASQRTHEIGIRMALGAKPGDVLKMVLSQSLTMIAVGVAIGLGISFIGAQAISSFLVGVSPSDPVTFVGVMVLLLGAALRACWIPARRATRVSPMVALRYE
jgi:predicted permease